MRRNSSWCFSFADRGDHVTLHAGGVRVGRAHAGRLGRPRTRRGARLDEDRDGGDAVGKNQVLGRHGGAGNRLQTAGHELEPGGHAQGPPTAFGGQLRHRSQLATRAHPLEPSGIDRRLDVARGYLVLDVELREPDVLDRVACAIRDDGLQRHRRFLVEPEPVAVTVNVAGTDVDHPHIAPEQAAALAHGEVVEAVELRPGGGQRLEQRAFVAPRLDQHHAPVRQVSVHFIAGAHDFAATAIERHQPFERPAILDPVDDAHRLDLPTGGVREQPVVIEGGQRFRHALEPGPRILARIFRMRGKRHQAGGDTEGGSPHVRAPLLSRKRRG